MGIVKKRFPYRAPLLFFAVVLIAAGVAWAVLQERVGDEGIPTSGYVASVRRDSIGCQTWIPFASHDCRVLIRIHHRLAGSSSDLTFTQVAHYYLLPPPAVAGGDPVAGYCAPATGRCHFDQLAEKPFALYGFLASLGAASLVAAWLYRRRKSSGV